MSVTTTKQKVNSARRQKKMTEPEAATKQTKPEPAVKQPSQDFDRQLQDHFAAEERRKVEEAAESVFGSVLARHGWVRNEHGQVEYVGGEGA